ncbi:MAG: hypothetical protein C7B45_05740 [Sulfobacillus acidophilus]|uniref:Gram-positive cocci surface proteins LPxTG domain-containing protein n=1 Tax=Sulfobacillus acidophilus TaxID=53633 RepID=A0A2T2WKE5_9FIRM|nr:MAG: hypothetical protein C7B45_05740 [Sulfobacillus acidophilus]
MKNYLTLGTVAAATLGLTLMVATPAFAHSTPGQFSLGSSTTNSGPNGTSPGSGNNNSGSGNQSGNSNPGPGNNNSGSGNQSGNSNPGPDNSCPTTPSDSLAIDYVGTTSGPPPTVTIKVSGLETSSQPPSNYTVRFFEAPIGTSSTPGTSAAWTPVGPPKAVSSSTQVFTMPYSVSTPGQLLGVAEYSGSGPSKCLVATDSPSNFVNLNNLPYGQLPEVPFAVGLPLIGLGAAALILKRRTA